MDEVLFQNIRLRPDTEYFLYVGELKTHCLAQFVRDALAARLQRDVDCITLMPDVLESYGIDNVMVINPEAQRLGELHGGRVSCRIPGRRFAEAVSASPAVADLLKRLRARQQEVLVYMYESLPEFRLDRDPAVRVIGPDGRLASQWNSKFFQYRKLEGIIPVVEFRICPGGLEELLAQVDAVSDRWRHGIFVTREYSAAGSGSILAHTRDEVRAWVTDPNAPHLISRYLPHHYDPTVLAVVASESEVFIAGVGDQQIVDLNKFRGSFFPSVLPAEIVSRLKDCTVTVGRELARTGYRGIFGCDYIVDEAGEVWFVEVNARKQGTTMEVTCTLENCLPPGSPTLPELECHAVLDGRFPPGVAALVPETPSIQWGTYNWKVEEEVFTNHHLPQAEDERRMFRRIMSDPEAGGSTHLILEHVGGGARVASGTFLGRVVAVGRDRPQMTAELERGKALLAGSVAG